MKFKTILLLSAIAVILGVISFWMGQLSYSWLPPQASVESQLIDNLFSFLVTIGTFIFLGVTGALVYSVLFHRAGKYDTSDGPPIEGNLTLEIVWTAIPFLLVLWIAIFSYQTYKDMGIRGPMEMAHMPMPEMVPAAYAETLDKTGEPITNIEVDAKQWSWVFRYPESNITSTELHLPVDRRAHLVLRSQDVIHGFFIPAFRVKQDAIPQQAIDFEFTPILTGTYRLRDSQYSGTYFAAMQADVVVESVEDYQNWLAEAAQTKPSVAPNQAAQEYALREEAGWTTIVPAAAPVVNYHP
ncbi:heme/copper-type cytochrome/quinol oxidase, subunit 2 [Xenococcus sp. PCC 7305]|uniref:cytochrome c oxidase subunit II n=1 Tax=Xenococcus sp. PCC 7305 TaxID=102125 RepID=UPI0002ABE3E8|nr:cytochrome c oxidase subunit II [Xenococcus sp. PCC 7305]ELS00808.1 heme/copper-type cytochrome/quinol oxidase, subunit 2 [Xenococcus sp. PCC 7305]